MLIHPSVHAPLLSTFDRRGVTPVRTLTTIAPARRMMTYGATGDDVGKDSDGATGNDDDVDGGAAGDNNDNDGDSCWCEGQLR